MLKYTYIYVQPYPFNQSYHEIAIYVSWFISKWLDICHKSGNQWGGIQIYLAENRESSL